MSENTLPLDMERVSRSVPQPLTCDSMAFFQETGITADHCHALNRVIQSLGLDTYGHPGYLLLEVEMVHARLMSCLSFMNLADNGSQTEVLVSDRGLSSFLIQLDVMGEVMKCLKRIQTIDILEDFKYVYDQLQRRLIEESEALLDRHSSPFSPTELLASCQAVTIDAIDPSTIEGWFHLLLLRTLTKKVFRFSIGPL